MLKKATVDGITAVLSYVIIEIAYWFFDFNYSLFQSDINFLLFLISLGCYFVIFLLIFNVLSKILVKK